MAKPDNIPVPNTNFYGWDYEEQTQMKHKVLDAYFKIWVSKLGLYYDTLFVDCHGGCGAYIKDGQLHYGSTILTHKTAAAVNNNPTRTKKHGNIICEIDADNFANLGKVFKYLGFEKIKAYNGDFNDIIRQDPVAKWTKQYPTLFFVDPFGYYNTPMANMATMLDTKGSEVLINFMFDFINRGIGIGGIDEAQLTAFFGGDDWKQAKALSGAERESFLIALYKRKLKETTGAKFVFAYRLCSPDKNRTYYYLVHAVKNIQGITHMKNSFATVNNGRIEYLGKRNDEISFFDLDSYKQGEIVALLKKEFAGKSLTFLDIWEAIVEDTGYLESDLRKAIQEMEQNGQATITRPPEFGKRRNGIKENDIVAFNGGTTWNK